MKIVDLLNPAAIVADLEAVEKDAVLEELAGAAIKIEKGLEHNEVLRVLQERERLGSTGIGEGVAIPHGKLRTIDQLLLSFGRSRKESILTPLTANQRSSSSCCLPRKNRWEYISKLSPVFPSY